jgi:hypothetical protein
MAKKKDKPTGNRTKAVKPSGELKLRLVRELLNQGKRNSEVKRLFAAQFNCAPRTAEDYLALVMAEMRAELEKPSADRRAVAHARWEHIYGDKSQSMGIRVRALENIDKIEGNYAPTKQAFTDTAGQDIPQDTGRRLTIAELDEELSKFAAGPDAVQP